ncbi:hypothetical protein T440DRAFT_487629 [Plenodomus tracheiphilus IPT5]|uniref:Uncharacterized protein n=1 Tax=Plenodomus tracheiphilus IPT5 TaxID=1408161 RepID=A0A6A7BFL6_9PLEO|nr:hypothetical protein T440DRAFT_487629 [Plenodomus tracheiphilus IPT5]
MAPSQQLLSLVNTLGKVASAALILPTSEALGQLKWNWFHKSNAMWDFEIFDKASRGAWGATLLLFRTKGRSLAALGALLIVLLLAIDTFFQQVVTFSDRWALQNESGLIPRVVNYQPPYQKYFIRGVEQGQTNKDHTPVVNQFLYGNGTQPLPFGKGIRPELPLSCPTSRCEWPEYETLSVCSSCAEVSPLLDISYACQENTTIDWSVNWNGPLSEEPYPVGMVCGFFLNATSTTPTLLSGYITNETEDAGISGESLIMRAIPLSDFNTKEPFYGVGSVAFKSIRNPIMSALIASAKDGLKSVHRKTAPQVHECMLSWCVQTIKSAYEGAEYTENIRSTYLDVSTDLRPWPWNVTDDYFVYTQNITLEPTIHRSNSTVLNDSYTVDNETAFTTMTIFDDFFPSSYTAENASTRATLRFKNYANGPATRYLDFNPWLAPNNITRHMERLATAMTNVIRSSTSKEMVAGDAYNTEKFVSITWEWLMFPLVLLILGLVFLVSTILKTSQVHNGEELWKTSAMPALIYGLPKETQGQLASSSAWRNDQSGKKVRVRLSRDVGWRVSGEGCTAVSLRVPPAAPTAPRGWI